MGRKVLLICGILSPILYGVSDVLAGMQWEGYSFRHQTISELGAIGAPSRALFAVLLLIVYGLMVAFGVGIRKTADEDRRQPSHRSWCNGAYRRVVCGEASGWD